MRPKHDTVVEVSSGSSDINGRFERFNTKLGEGAFKRVYKAFDTLDQIDVAWNIIDLSSVHVDAEKQRIFRECDTLRKLHHPNILRITAQWWDEESDHLNFITNLVHDGSLSKYFKNRKINLRRIKQIARQILSALSYLHENGIIHRDLKGDNIFIEGNTGNIVIGDLGLSCNIVSARSIVGTPHYMAPDVYKEDYNELVDIWAFGMVILELITGQMPFSECKGTYQAYQAIISGKKPSILSDISNPYIRSFIDICLNTNATCRPSAAELLEHPFLFERLSDRKLCSSFIKTKKEQYPEPPPSPATIATKHGSKPDNTRSKPPIDDAQSMKLPPSQLETRGQLPKQKPLANGANAETADSQNLAPERVAVTSLQVVNATQTKLEMRIFSHSFANKKKVMNVAFTYDTKQDSPDAVAQEMVQTLKLKQFFVAKIRDCILRAIESIPKTPTPQKKTAAAEVAPVRSSTTSTTAPATATAPKSKELKESVRARAKLEMEEWLAENGLEKLIPTFNEQGIAIEHLQCIANDPAMIQRLCDDMRWDIFVQIKLKKAVLDLYTSDSQRVADVARKEQEAITSEQALILDELNGKHTALSNDLKQMKDAVNGITRSANECSQAVRQNAEAMTQLIEQDRDRLLQQIEETKERRKQQMEVQLGTLQSLSDEVQSAQQQIASVIEQSNSEPPQMRYRRIQNIVSKLNESEQQLAFDPTAVNQSDFKLRIDLDLQRFVCTLQSTMTLRFSSEKFEQPLAYSNVQRDSKRSSHPSATKSSSDVGGENESKSKSPAPEPAARMQLPVVAIDTIELDFDETEFVLTTSSSMSPGALHPPNVLLPLQSLQLEHNINATATPTATQSPLQSSDSFAMADIAYSNMQRAASADLKPSDYQDHHMSPIKSLATSKQAPTSTTQTSRSKFNFAANNAEEATNQLGVPLRMSKSQSTFAADATTAAAASVVSPRSAQQSTGSDISGMRRRNTVHLLVADQEDDDADAVLVDGYIRHYCKRNRVVLLPAHLRSLSYSYYHFDCALLKFSKIYKSDQGWRLYDGNTCIKRLKVATSVSHNGDDDDDDGEQQIWIAADMQPVRSGIHCWRLNVRNPNKGALVIGICPPQMLKSESDHQRLVYGIGIGTTEQCWYPSARVQPRSVDAQIFHQSQCQIDMKLNLLTGQLCFVLVKHDDSHHHKLKETQQATIGNVPVPVHRHQGWLPYVKSLENSVGLQLKMAVCPTTWYGRYKDTLFE